MKLLLIDLTTGLTKERLLDDPLLGGRLLSGQLVSEFVKPGSDPLSSDNVLVFAAGPLAGHRVSTAGRVSVGGKSPLTGGIKEANAGGMAGDSLANLGYRAMVFSGSRPQNEPCLFILDENGPRFAKAQSYRGLGNEALVEVLTQEYGKDFVIISIGPAGELRLGAASIAITDEHGKPFRFAARGGLGALMGSKGLKAVLLHRVETPKMDPINNKAHDAIIGFNKFVAGSERSKDLREFGTASTVMMVQTLAGLPVKNFSRGSLPAAEPIGGEALRDLILARGGVGTPTEACMKGCVIQCSNILADEHGKLAVAPLEYETLGLCGANLNLISLDDIARINRLCNDFGLDTIEIGASLGVMMEAAESGQIPEAYRDLEFPHFGDGKRSADLIPEIIQGTALGKLLGNGVVATGHALGVRHIPAVKGQAMSAYDPRVIKGTGITYATSPQGADHTAGLTVFAPVDPRDPEKAISLSRNSQIQRASYDALGMCVFNLSATGGHPELLLDMLRDIYQVELPSTWLDELGRRVIRVELAFNKSSGFTHSDDKLPSYFTKELLPPRDDVFDVPQTALDHFWEDL
jgi:aldehyde:ferredoxin oxidoreductase